MRLSLVFIIVVFLINFVNASCSDNQIDINSASLEELKELIGIGPGKAQAIVDERPYESLDDLVNAYGIAEATLKRIKSQGLACVEEDKMEEEKEESKIVAEKIIEIKTGEVINLAPKDIKKEGSLKKLDKSNYAVYGFILFSILLAMLFVLKLKKQNKDEIE